MFPNGLRHISLIKPKEKYINSKNLSAYHYVLRQAEQKSKARRDSIGFRSNRGTLNNQKRDRLCERLRVRSGLGSRHRGSRSSGNGAGQ